MTQVDQVVGVAGLTEDVVDQGGVRRGDVVDRGAAGLDLPAGDDLAVMASVRSMNRASPTMAVGSPCPPVTVDPRGDQVGCAGASSWRWTITSNHWAREPPAMYESGPPSGRPRVLMGASSHLRTGAGAGVWRSTANWSRPTLPNGRSNQPGAGGGRVTVAPGPRLTVPWSKVKPIDRYRGPYQRRRYEPAVA